MLTWRIPFFIVGLLAVSATPSYGQIIELAHNEPFAGEKSFCVQVTGPVTKSQPFLLTYILQLGDKSIPVTYKLNGKLMKDVTVDYNLEGQETVQQGGKYVFTFATNSKTNIKSFEVHGSAGPSGTAELGRCK